MCFHFVPLTPYYSQSRNAIGCLLAPLSVRWLPRHTHKVWKKNIYLVQVSKVGGSAESPNPPVSASLVMMTDSIILVKLGVINP